jgi:hypothetical protein
MANSNYYITHYQHPPRGFWSKMVAAGAVSLIVGCVGYTAYMEGYRRGAMDTATVIEDRADKFIGRVEQRLFGNMN